jgi:hypothetical protein
MTWIKPLLGKWIVVENGIGTLAPEFYYALVTMHGTILVFFVLTAGLSGTFSNLLIPLQLGARDMASPFMNMLSYWFFFMAGIVMFYSLFISTGPFAGGWTAYPPLSALPQASQRYDSVVGKFDSFCGFRSIGWYKLHYNGIEPSNERNELVENAFNNLGIFCNCNLGSLIFPSVSIRIPYVNV